MSENTFEKIYALVRKIPSGRVASYGQLAILAGMPRGARVVGYAMAACPHADVPCHRVVDRFGGTKPAFDAFSPGVQRALLEAEGIEFTPDGFVDLARFRWQPDDADFSQI